MVPGLLVTLWARAAVKAPAAARRIGEAWSLPVVKKGIAGR